MRRQGVKIDLVCEIVSDLNRRLHNKLFSLVAPQSIREAGCFFVMGSEGRGEQTFRTDQDNGLILAAPVPEEDLVRFRADVFDALAQCGFPPCPGEVMVRNPVWSKTLDDYRDDFRRWLAVSDETGTMDIAIFYDAEATAGDAALLRAAKQDLIDLMHGERVRLARFARAIDAFPTPIGFFNNLVTSKAEGDALDLKKGGIFPIVHGVRALSLEKGLHETATTARIARLAELDVFDGQFARELTQALHYLMTLRLDAQIAEKASDEPRQARRTVDHGARPAARRLPGGEATARDAAAPLQSGDVLMLLGLKRRILLHLLRDPAYRFLFEPAAARRSGVDRLRDDGPEHAQGRHRDGRRHQDPRQPNPDQRALRGDGQAKGQAQSGRNQGPSPARAGRRRRAPDRRGAARRSCASSARGPWSGSISNSTSRC